MYNNKIQLDKDKYESFMETIKEKTKLKDFNIHVSKAYNTVRDRGQILFKYTLENQRKENEQEAYEKYVTENPKKYVGPQHYWKFPKIDPRKKPGQIKIPTEDENGQKTYFLDRKTTDKRVYKPMKQHLF